MFVLLAQDWLDNDIVKKLKAHDNMIRSCIKALIFYYILFAIKIINYFGEQFASVSGYKSQSLVIEIIKWEV